MPLGGCRSDTSAQPHGLPGSAALPIFVTLETPRVEASGGQCMEVLALLPVAPGAGLPQPPTAPRAPVSAP